MPLSATHPYIAWQEDPMNSDTAVICCCRGPTPAAVGKRAPQKEGSAEQCSGANRKGKIKTAGENSKQEKIDSG